MLTMLQSFKQRIEFFWIILYATLVGHGALPEQQGIRLCSKAFYQCAEWLS